MFKEVKLNEIKENLGESLKNNWGLVTAGKENDLNTMTISWNGFGFAWNMNIVTIYIKSTRYTINYLDREEYFTISLFDEKYKEKLALCGKKSGKDTDKVKETGLTVINDKAPYFEEASIVLVCRKIAKINLKDAEIYDKNIIDKHNQTGDYHYAYNGCIEKVLIKK